MASLYSKSTTQAPVLEALGLPAPIYPQLQPFSAGVFSQRPPETLSPRPLVAQQFTEQEPQPSEREGCKAVAPSRPSHEARPPAGATATSGLSPGTRWWRGFYAAFNENNQGKYNA